MKLFFKLMLSIILVSSFVGIISFSVMYDWSSQSFENIIQTEQELSLQKLRQTVEIYPLLRVRELFSVTNGTLSKHVLQSAEATNSINEELFSFVSTSPHYDVVSVVNANNTISYSSLPYRTGRVINDYPRLKEVVFSSREKGTFISDVLISEDTSKPTVLIGIKVGEHVTVGQMSWLYLLEEILTKEGNVSFFSSSGDFLGSSNQQFSSSILVRNFASDPFFQQAKSSDGSSFIVENLLGEEVLATSTPASFGSDAENILISVETSSKTVFAPVRNITFTLLIILFFFIVALLVLVSVFIQIYVNKPLKMLQKSAQKISEGNLAEHLPETKRTDEIGVLHNSLEGMRHELHHLTLNLNDQVEAKTVTLKETIRDLNTEVQRQELLANIASLLMGAQNIDTSLQESINLLGTVMDVSRIYLFENEGDELTTNTFEWCNEGITPQKENLQKLPYQTIDGWKDILLEDGYLEASDIGKLPVNIQRILLPQNIKSILVFPVYIKSEYAGFVGFDECTKTRKWNSNEIVVLSTISQVIGNALERRQTEAEILSSLEKQKVLNEELRKADVLKTQFLSITSHELRTPLTPMQAQLQLLLRRKFGEITEKQQSSVEMVLRNTVRLNHLIGDILDLSKIESGNMKFIMEPFSINQVMKNVHETMSFRAKDAGVHLVYEPVEGIDLFVFDPDRIEQVTVNFVNNAIKFSPDNGTVTMKLIRLEHSIRVEVTDTGIGIKKENCERIFQPFEQVDSSESRKYGGSGLGLAISKGIIEAHSGEIGVHSTFGEGSTFFFTIPYEGNDATEHDASILK